MLRYFSLLLVSVLGISNAQLFGAHSIPLGLYAGDSFAADSGYAGSDVYLNPMELAQIMDAQRAEEMRGYSAGAAGGPSYGGSPYGGYGGPAAPTEPQGPPDGPPNGYGEADHSEGPPGDGPNEGSNYHQGPEGPDDYQGPPQQGGEGGGGGHGHGGDGGGSGHGGDGGGGGHGHGGGYNQGPPQQYDQQGEGPQGGGPGDNDGGYSNEGDAYRQEGPPQHYEDERAPPGRGNGYNNGPPQHGGNGYGQDGLSDNYNGKYRQLIVERPHQQHGRPQGYQNENGYESNAQQFEGEQRHPTYESSGYENDKALKPHALPEAQYIQPSSGYSQPDYESNNAPNNNGGFRPSHGPSGTQTATHGYNTGTTREYYQSDPV